MRPKSCHSKTNPNLIRSGGSSTAKFCLISPLPSQQIISAKLTLSRKTSPRHTDRCKPFFSNFCLQTAVPKEPLYQEIQVPLDNGFLTQRGESAYATRRKHPKPLFIQWKQENIKHKRQQKLRFRNLNMIQVVSTSSLLMNKTQTRCKKKSYIEYIKASNATQRNSSAQKSKITNQPHNCRFQSEEGAKEAKEMQKDPKEVVKRRKVIKMVSQESKDDKQWKLKHGTACFVKTQHYDH